MPSSGMSNAGISIIAYNYGAREKRRIVDTLWISLRVNLVIALFGMLVFLLFPGQLLAMFNASDAMAEIGIPALRMIAGAMVLTTSTQILSGFLQALGQGTAGNLTSGISAVERMAAVFDRQRRLGLAGFPHYGGPAVCDRGNSGRTHLPGEISCAAATGSVISSIKRGQLDATPTLA